METIRVVLADDHPAVRLVLHQMLDCAPGITVVAEVASAQEALRVVRALMPDVLLLDMNLCPTDGLQMLRRLRTEAASVRVIAMGTLDDVEHVLDFLEAGANGYLAKRDASSCIAEAVRAVMQPSRGWLSPCLLHWMGAWGLSGCDRPCTLTPRELEVLSLVAAGRTNRQIGQTLGISVKTVEKHLAAIFSKLRAASRAEAAVLAVRQGLLSEGRACP